MVDSSFHGWPGLLCFFSFMVALSFHGLSLYGIMKWVEPAINFRDFFHCLAQVATNYRFISDISVTLLLRKCLSSIKTEKVLVKTLEHKVKDARWSFERHAKELILLTVAVSQQPPRFASLYFYLILVIQLAESVVWWLIYRTFFMVIVLVLHPYEYM